MEDLIQAVNVAIEELEGYYDGAPDSPTLWLGRVLDDLRTASEKAERVMLNWQAHEDDKRYLYRDRY